MSTACIFTTEFGGQLSASFSSRDGWMRDFQFLIWNHFLTIKKKFIKLVYEVRQSLGKKVPPSKIVAYLLSKYTISDVYDNAHYKTISLFSDADKKALELATSVDEIFLVVRKYWSFLKYDMIYGIVHHCGDHEDQALVKDYQEELEALFDKRKISEVLEVLVSVDEDKDRIIIKLDKEDPSWKEITDLELKISALLGIMPSALLIIGVQQRGMKIIFTIPKHIAQIIFSKSLTSKQRDCFRAASVLWLSCGDIHWSFIVSCNNNMLKIHVYLLW